MKTHHSLTIMLALSAAVNFAGLSAHAQTDAEAVLPASIAPDSDAAQIIKLVQAGVQMNVITSFISNCAAPFNLDAGKIIALNDAGVPSNVIDAMMAHDRNISANATPPASPVVVSTDGTTPPSDPVTVDYFNTALSPYGSWVEVGGYGRCWRPTTVIYDANWRPYCDRGHWVYTDCGWYWDSDYAWGATFHYGRWFRDARFGWCWWPDTDWAPSWVLWRSGGADCGWAPLPPRCLYRPEHGFFYNGSIVTVGFDFGFDEDYFTFVPLTVFCDRHVRDHREDPGRVRGFFRNTTVINNYNFGGAHRTIINGGISVDRVSTAERRPIRPVSVSELPNASRQGWRGDAGNNHKPPGSINHSGSDAILRQGAPGGKTATADSQNWQHSSRLDQQRLQSQNSLVTKPPQAVRPVTPIPNSTAAGDRSSRLGQQSWVKQQNQNVPPAINPKPTTVTPQVSSTPNGAGLQPNHSSRLEQQRTRQLENRVVQSEANTRPVEQNTVLQPSSGFMRQQIPTQTESHLNQENRASQNANSEPARPAPATAPSGSGNQNSDSHKSDRDRNNH